MTSAVIRRRVQGVAFLAVVISLIGLSIAKYSGAFSDGIPVTMRVDHTGLQLDKHSDVKVRGLIVGEVTDLSSSGAAATVALRLKPEMVHLIPDNVSARLLPKTLFGEKYVALILPPHPSGRPLSAGDVIAQDRSQPARELDAALDSLLPLLQDVAPQDLASTLGAISGAVAGLVAITPAAGFVAPMPALAIGFVAGAFCYWMVTRVKAIFGYDDALDAFGVHGVGGTIGALLTGVFASQVVNPIFGSGKPVGGIDGHWGQVGNQLVGILIAWGFALVGTLTLLKLVDSITGLRVTEDEEIKGLDITQHGEEAYNLES